MYQKFAMLLSALGCVAAVACSQSDPGITTAVKAKLAGDDTVKAYQIDVDTANGVVTLSGAVESSAAKDQAVLIARNTNGVRDVVDHITVNPGAAPTTGDLDDAARDLANDARDKADRAADETKEAAGRAADETKDAARDARRKAGDAADRAGEAVTDASLTTAVKAKLLADSMVSGLNIDVDTSHRVVTLNGTAKTKAEADRAVMLARQTDGVMRVVNNVKIAR